MRLLLSLFISIFINAVALIAVAQIFESFHLDGFGTALLASIILGLLNVFIKPILILLTFPITIVTLGLFLFVVNAITLMIAQSLMGSSFVIESFGTAFIASIVISFITLVFNRLIVDARR